MSDLSKPTAPKDSFQTVTDRLIKALEEGTAPWQKPWQSVDMGALRNHASGKPYHGINVLMLYEKGVEDPRFMTFKQIKERGWKVKKGAKAEHVYYYESLNVDERDKSTGQFVIDAATGKPRQIQIPFLQASAVFNGADIVGIPPIAPVEREFSPIQAGEELVKRSPVPIEQTNSGRAFYNIAKNAISMPPKESFTSAEAYYATLSHEMIHSTGHSDRCNREFGKRFGDNAYAFEELVAEIGGVMIRSELGLNTQDISNHASYVDHWLQILKQDKKAIFLASSQATKAVDFLMGRNSLDAKAAQKSSAENATKSAVAAEPPSAPIKIDGGEAVPLAAMIPSTLAVVAKLKARRANPPSPDQKNAPSPI